MKILFFGNNWVAWQIVSWLRRENDNICGLVLHPETKRKYGRQIIRAADIRPEYILDGSQLREPSFRDAVRRLQPDIGLSILFDYLFDRPLLDCFPQGVINLHPGMLPYNRGQYPNVWSIVERVPAGTTLHFIDESIDTGDIIAQQPVSVDITDTGLTLYRKLEQASVDLFRKTWPSIRAGRAGRVPQNGDGSYHRSRDVDSIDCIQLDQSYTARDLINLLRARTFPPYRGAYFEENGRRVYLRLELSEDLGT